jgi:hypothetical protein
MSGQLSGKEYCLELWKGKILAKFLYFFYCWETVLKVVWIRSRNRNRNFSKVGNGTTINHYGSTRLPCLTPPPPRPFSCSWSGQYADPGRSSSIGFSKVHAGYIIEVASYGVRYVYTNIQLVPDLLGSEPKTVYRRILHTTSERDCVEFKQSTKQWQKNNKKKFCCQGGKVTIKKTGILHGYSRLDAKKLQFSLKC